MRDLSTNKASGTWEEAAHGVRIRSGAGDARCIPGNNIAEAFLLPVTQAVGTGLMRREASTRWPREAEAFVYAANKAKLGASLSHSPSVILVTWTAIASVRLSPPILTRRGAAAWFGVCGVPSSFAGVFRQFARLNAAHTPVAAFPILTQSASSSAICARPSFRLSQVETSMERSQDVGNLTQGGRHE